MTPARALEVCIPESRQASKTPMEGSPQKLGRDTRAPRDTRALGTTRETIQVSDRDWSSFRVVLRALGATILLAAPCTVITDDGRRVPGYSVTYGYEVTS